VQPRLEGRQGEAQRRCHLGAAALLDVAELLGDTIGAILSNAEAKAVNADVVNDLRGKLYGTAECAIMSVLKEAEACVCPDNAAAGATGCSSCGTVGGTTGASDTVGDDAAADGASAASAAAEAPAGQSQAAGLDPATAQARSTPLTADELLAKRDIDGRSIKVQVETLIGAGEYGEFDVELTSTTSSTYKLFITTDDDKDNVEADVEVDGEIVKVVGARAV
jgi:hypothetical protein